MKHRLVACALAAPLLTGLTCGAGEVQRGEVEAGTTFHFDYWGP